MIGAGFAGLTAARKLAGHDVVVLEAGDRVGGRAWTVTSALGSAVDLGGMWVGADHHRLAALAAEAGMTVFPTPTRGALAYLDDRGVRKGLPPLTALAAGWALLRMSEEDGTVADWLRRFPRARPLLDAVLSEALAADTDQVSVRALRSGVRAVGGFRVVLGVSGGAQDGLLSGGAGGLAEWLATGLDVRLGCPATAIRRSPGGVVVETPAGPVHADRAVVAVPPPVARGIQVGS
ncbi:hypothetical protein GCM10023148_57340 [Actinokineospora soli]